MKKIISLILTFFCIATLSAQPILKQKKEQIKALKVAYITEELQLTPDEASKFWPLYNTFEDRQKDYKKDKLKGYLNRIDPSTIDNLTEKEATAMLAQIEAAEEEAFQARKKFIASLKGILPANKIIKLKQAEEGFNRKLLKQYKEKLRN
ncbi:sensor of ECF-type sigma factor [Flavobacterium sp. CYK-55]|uniref:sensor of ECF-type sigma factor n=1 Tax=Flavobacterium sp. CYK-55 TaxID=2835529 RepID=UPI001BCC0AB9|nr:sensor of ECF-type sigma factor [Flavobacterium sp. CYK-55]MBS7788065.1 sensor of ECF-type sigma factor [Flavobacterium sp. CYK-55]